MIYSGSLEDHEAVHSKSEVRNDLTVVPNDAKRRNDIRPKRTNQDDSGKRRCLAARGRCLAYPGIGKLRLRGSAGPA